MSSISSTSGPPPFSLSVTYTRPLSSTDAKVSLVWDAVLLSLCSVACGFESFAGSVVYFAAMGTPLGLVLVPLMVLMILPTGIGVCWFAYEIFCKLEHNASYIAAESMSLDQILASSDRAQHLQLLSCEQLSEKFDAYVQNKGPLEIIECVACLNYLDDLVLDFDSYPTVLESITYDKAHFHNHFLAYARCAQASNGLAQETFRGMCLRLILDELPSIEEQRIDFQQILKLIRWIQSHFSENQEPLDLTPLQKRLTLLFEKHLACRGLRDDLRNGLSQLPSVVAFLNNEIRIDVHELHRMIYEAIAKYVLTLIEDHKANYPFVVLETMQKIYTLFKNNTESADIALEAQEFAQFVSTQEIQQLIVGSFSDLNQSIFVERVRDVFGFVQRNHIPDGVIRLQRMLSFTALVGWTDVSINTYYETLFSEYQIAQTKIHDASRGERKQLKEEWQTRLKEIETPDGVYATLDLASAWRKELSSFSFNNPYQVLEEWSGKEILEFGPELEELQKRFKKYCDSDSEILYNIIYYYSIIDENSRLASTEYMCSLLREKTQNYTYNDMQDLLRLRFQYIEALDLLEYASNDGLISLEQYQQLLQDPSTLPEQGNARFWPEENVNS